MALARLQGPAGFIAMDEGPLKEQVVKMWLLLAMRRGFLKFRALLCSAGSNAEH